MLRLAIAAVFGLLGFQQAPAAPLTVSAAVSLTEVLQEVAGHYRTATAERVVCNFAASNVLARQIVNGAPVDLFVSADAAQMDVVERAGLAAAGTRVALLGNQLAIVTRRDHPSPPGSGEALADARVRRLAIGDPEAVPAGVYARRYLERAGLWRVLEPRIIPSGSVRGALAAVVNGAADAGIVYVTDARSAADVRVAAILAGPHAPDIVYPAAVISTSRQQEAARRLLSYLQSDEAGRVFARYGFVPRPARR